ncbi:helix-turn-helix domain-containing protein [Ktedonosporobacter rubrisoli]|uniref:Helix-turn-helix domain-containing protein n=1 Tax=Ktedonosporobacter rubrisoli TaxID=2509675 RepID=A0A4P6JYS7_KTERU|nr:helix-turn-helix domain-containing protein [Ktedonosporobacter rubrisoli]QBD80715.1 helix-turn-helix domain-containing protein [Ktedonosporobacter rubrisoli]
MKILEPQDGAAESPEHMSHSQEPAHEARASDSPFVEQIRRIWIERESASLCSADGHWNMLLVRYQGETSFSVWGPMTQGGAMHYPQGAEFLSITFTLGTFISQMPVGNLLDKGQILPRASANSFWLDDFSWRFPEYEHVEAFINKLVRKGLLVHEPVVDAVLQGQSSALSKRSVQRRFLRATGLSLRTLQSFERARHAAALLQQGVPLLDTVEEAGYFDQSHLTRALKRFSGQTPAQIARTRKP